MLANNYILQQSVNQPHFQNILNSANNFPTPEFQDNMTNYNVSDFPSDNYQVPWNPTGIIDNTERIFGCPVTEIITTNLRAEAEEFVPKGISTANIISTPLVEVPYVNYDKRIDENVSYNSLHYYSDVSISNSENYNTTHWPEEQINENSQNTNATSPFGLNFSVEAPEFVPRINNIENTDKPSEVMNANFSIEQHIAKTIGENSSSSNIILSSNTSHNLEQLRQTHFTEDVTSKNEKSKDGDHRPREYQEKSNNDYQNEEQENPQNEKSYQPKNKLKNAQSFQESLTRKRNDESGNYRRQYTNRKEERSSYNSEENDPRQNRKFGKIEDQNTHYNNDRRKNSYKSQGLKKNKSQERPDTKGCTTDINIQVIPDVKGSTTDIIGVEVKMCLGTAEVKSVDKTYRHAKNTNEESNNVKPEAQCTDGDDFKSKRFQKKSANSENSEIAKLLTEQKEKTEEHFNKSSNDPKLDIEHKILESDTSKVPDNSTNSFDEEQFSKKKERRSLDSVRSLKHPKNKTKYHSIELNNFNFNNSANQDDVNKNRYQRKSLGYSKSFRDQRPDKEKTFRDVVFEDRKRNEKFRDLKQERNGSKIEKTNYERSNEEFKSKRYSGDQNIENLFDKKYAENDKEYKAFLQELHNNKTSESIKLKEINKDLFEMPKEYSLAHCVAEDMRMGSGIAVTFRKTFKCVGELLQTKPKPGGLAVLKRAPGFLYYLVTKRRSRDKPTYKDFWCSMQKLREHMVKHKIDKLAVPRLGCGLDRLDWQTVKHIMTFLFKEVAVEIIVCNFYQQSDDAVPRNLYSVNICNKHENLIGAKEPVILYFSSGDSHVSEEMRELDEKFKFLDNFNNTPKGFGIVVKYKTNECTLCGCTVRKTATDVFQFVSFSKCLVEVGQLVKDNGYNCIAMQHIRDENDDLLHQKVITMLVNYLRDVDVYVYAGELDLSYDET